MSIKKYARVRMADGVVVEVGYKIGSDTPEYEWFQCHDRCMPYLWHYDLELKEFVCPNSIREFIEGDTDSRALKYGPEKRRSLLDYFRQ